MNRVHLMIASALMTGACLTLTAHAATTLAEWTFGEPGVAVVEADNSASANTGSNMVPHTGTPVYTTSAAPYGYSNGRGITGGSVGTKTPNFFGDSDFPGAFTFEAIFQAGSTVGNSETKVLLTMEQMWELAIVDRDPTAAVAPEFVWSVAGTVGSGPSTPFALDANFHHVAGIYDPALTIDGTNNSFLYFDGVLVDAESQVKQPLGAPGTGVAAGQHLFLARDSANRAFWNGTILDSVRFSTGVVSPNLFTNVIPEPASLTILAACAAALVRRRPSPSTDFTPRMSRSS